MKTETPNETNYEASPTSPVQTPSDLERRGVNKVVAELRKLLADVFTLYVKTKNFHWHMSGSHFRDYHLLLDEHADQIFAMTDDIASNRRLQDNSAEFVPPLEMLTELSQDNQRLTQYLRATHAVCDEANDVATASLIENWIDETERRTWFLAQTIGNGE